MSLLQAMPYVILREFDDYSKELAGGTIEFLASSTDVHLPTYQDAQGTTPNLNPLPLDQGGSAVVFLQSGVAYDIIIKAADGTQVRKLLGISVGVSGSEGTSTIVTNYDALRALSQDYDLVFVQGREIVGDGGEGWFEYLPSSSLADDDGVCLLRASSRYKRLVTGGVLDPRWYGVTYGTTADQSTTIAAALVGSSTWNLETAIAGKVYLTQDLHIATNVRILPGGGFYGTGIIYFDTGSQLLECSARAFAGASGNCPVYFASGTTSVVIPDWFDAGDDSRLAFANASTAPSTLWPTTGVTQAGWVPSTKQHTPGNTLALSGVLTTPLASQAADISFNLTRPDTVDLGSGSWTISDGWQLNSTDVLSYVLQRLTSGGTGSAVLPTICKAGLAYTVSFTIVNQANPDHGNTVGTFTVNFNGADIAASTSAGTTTYSQTLTIASSNPALTITPSQYAYGYVTGVSITCARTIHDNKLADAAYTHDSTWDGNQASGFTHTQGAATDLSAAIALTAGHKYRGSFSITRVSPPTTNLLANVTPTVDSQFTGATSSGFRLSGWADGAHDVSWNLPTTPGTEYLVTPTFSDSPVNDVVDGNGGHSYQWANHDAVAIWAGGMALTDDAAGYGAGSARSFIATGTTTKVTLRVVCAANHVETVEAGNLKFGYLGTTTLAVTATNDIGSLAVSVGGTQVTVNENYGVIQKSGNYTFRVEPAASSQNLVITPTSDFFGTVASLSLLDETQGSVGVYVGTSIIGTASETRNYTISGTGLTGIYVKFVPTLDFDGAITDVAVSKHASNATIKLISTYTVTENVSISAPCDPWQGRLLITAPANLLIPNIINDNASQFIEYGALSFIGDNDFGAIEAQPEWAGAVGDGGSDDTIPLAFALASSSCYLAGQYRATKSFTVGAISALGPLLAAQGSASSPGIKLDDGVVVTCSSLTAQGIAIVHGNASKIVNSGSSRFANVYYYDASSSTGASLTTTQFDGESSVISTVRGIANTIGGDVDNCTISGTASIYPSTPVAVIANANRTTFANCNPFTGVNGGKLLECTFKSPRAWQISIPSGAAVEVSNCYSDGNLAYLVDATSTLNCYNIRGIQDTAANTSDSATSDALTRRLLSNGIGIVNEWTTETNKPVRTTLNGKTFDTFTPMPASYPYFKWTGNMAIWSALFQYPANLESPHGAWYKDGYNNYHYWHNADSPSLLSEGVTCDGTSLTVHSPGESSWTLTTKASDDVSTHMGLDALPDDNVVPSVYDKAMISFIPLFGHVLELSITVPANMHATDSLVSSIDVNQIIRYVLPTAAPNNRFDRLNTSAQDLIVYHKGFILPKSSSSQVIKVKIPVLFGCSADGLYADNTGGYPIYRPVPKLSVIGTNCDGITINLVSNLVLPNTSDLLPLWTESGFNCKNCEIIGIIEDFTGHSIKMLTREPYTNSYPTNGDLFELLWGCLTYMPNVSLYMVTDSRIYLHT